MNSEESKAISDVLLLLKSLAALTLVLFGFIVGHCHEIALATSALGGPALMLLGYAWQDSEEQTVSVHLVFDEVEWVAFFFGGLFVIVAGVEHVGLLEMAAHYEFDVTESELKWTAFLIFWSSGNLFAILGNSSFAIMFPLSIESTDTTCGDKNLEPLWRLLALDAYFW